MVTEADIGPVIYGVSAFLVLLVIPGTVTWLKGQRLVFFVGFLLAGIIWTVAAFRLARPDSWWARHFYQGDKLARATRRYSG